MKIAVAQLNFKIGDFENNYKKIIHVIDQQKQNVDLIIFSELALSGYYPKDLIECPKFIATQDKYLKQLAEHSNSHSLTIVIGAIGHASSGKKSFHNTLFVIEKGNFIYQYHKMRLPVYNVFDEARHFNPGSEVGFYSIKDQNIGFLICEDGWYSEDIENYLKNPIPLLKEKNPDFVVSIHGSPSNIGKQKERIQHFSTVAKTLNCPLIFCNQVGGNDDLVFDGCSFILSQTGSHQGELESFKEDIGILEIHNNKINPQVGFKQRMELSTLELFFKQTVLGLRDYVEKCQFKGVVLGLSGGIDSALTLAIAQEALGSKAITALAMPTRYSSEHSKKDAVKLCKNLEVQLIFYDIEPQFRLSCTQFEKIIEHPPSPLTEQNLQARIRGQMLMAHSNQFGGLVLSTGNKSEISVGYTTLYGDMTGGLNVIGDLYKTEVYALAEYINQKHQPNDWIPTSILKKPPSAELAPNQLDTDSLPPYDVLDPILKLHLEGDLLTDNERQEIEQTLNNVPQEIIQDTLQKIQFSEFKRQQSPPIIRVQKRAFGIGRQIPIAAKTNY